MEFYKKYRPQSLQEMTLTKPMAKMLEKWEMPHFTMLVGKSGVGKTTLARIMASNMGDCLLREFNSADFRGIDFVREICDQLLSPPITHEKICYILDECHKLTGDAQNAFLKTLEDTPDWAYLILCTTEPTKLIPALRSRAYEVRMPIVSKDRMFGLLERVCKKEGLEPEAEVYEIIIEKAFGNARKALILLENWSYCNDPAILDIEEEEASKVIIDLCRQLIRGNWHSTSIILKTLEDDPETVRRVVCSYMTTVLLNDKSKAEDASIVLDNFIKPFYEGGKAALANACYKSFLT